MCCYFEITTELTANFQFFGPRPAPADADSRSDFSALHASLPNFGTARNSGITMEFIRPNSGIYSVGTAVLSFDAGSKYHR
jgi:hypothetical protein